MENQIIEAATLGGSVADMDFSVWALFVRADVVVKAVIILLLVASVWCWAIIFDKVVSLRRPGGSRAPGPPAGIFPPAA